MRRGLLLGVAAAVLAAACGSSDDDGAADTTTGAPATAAPATDPAEAEPPSAPEPTDTATTGTDPTDPPPTDETPALVDDDTELSLAITQATEVWPTDWERRTVGLDEFRLGIGARDPRDRIPPIDDPVFEPIVDADWLDEREPGALVRFGGEVRFYPLSILTRHEIVNDEFGDVPVVVTYCPLCNTAISFDARVDGQTLRFGVSGLLRNSDLVMWDDATTSLWQQITGEAIVGEFAGTELDLIPTSIVAYGDVVEDFPEAVSLSRDTGFGIEYGTNPYIAYSSSTVPFLFDGEPDPRFPPLSRVVGVTLDDDAIAYPFSVLTDERAVNDELAGTPIAVLWGGDTADALDTSAIAEGEAIGSGIAYDRRVGGEVLTFEPAAADTFVDAETGTTWTLLGRAVDGPLAGEQLETITHRNEFWFAWAAFNPDAPVYEP